MNETYNIYQYIGNCRPFCIIAGPCVIESYDITMHIASEIKKLTDELSIPFIFKASFDKANRSSHEAYRGPGIKEGLAILSEVKYALGIPLITDIHQPEQAEKAAEVVDIIQIPSFLCRQTDLVKAAASTGKIINIKKGQFLAPWDVKNIIHKVETAGNNKIIITERGVSFGYNNLIVDMQGMLQMKEFGYPIIFDATHSVQTPGGNGQTSGGNAEYVPGLAKASVALGIAGVFFEVHPEPANSLSDSMCMLKLDKLGGLLKTLKELDKIAKQTEN